MPAKFALQMVGGQIGSDMRAPFNNGNDVPKTPSTFELNLPSAYPAAVVPRVQQFEFANNFVLRAFSTQLLGKLTNPVVVVPAP